MPPIFLNLKMPSCALTTLCLQLVFYYDDSTQFIKDYTTPTAAALNNSMRQHWDAATLVHKGDKSPRHKATMVTAKSW